MPERLWAQYNGKQAVEQFQELGGLTDAIALENQGDGSAGLHWNENLFQDELMTHDINLGNESNGNAPISTVTLASLADLGYEVNLNGASSDYELLGGEGFNADDLTPEQVAAFHDLAEKSFAAPDAEYIAPIMPTVDPDKVAPEIWAHAERFWKNGEYYDWVDYQIKPGDTLSHLAQRKLGNGSYDYYMWIANHNGIANPNYIVAWEWIKLPQHHPNYEWKQEQERRRREAELRKKQEEEARKRREQEERLARDKAEQERKRREEEERRKEAERKRRELEEQERRLREEMERRRQEEERRKEEERLRELERQREIARQQGKGGQDWFFATPLPEFGPVDPFETKLTGETVGNLVPDDYYRFTLSRGGRITAELKQLLADADLVLYDVRNKPIAYSMREGITDEQIITDLIPGTYMLRVNSPEGVTTDYDLMVKFQHKLSMTQKGPPPGWKVGNPGNGSGGTVPPGAIFADPRIQSIYDTALNNFAGPERAKANAKIAELEREKRSYEQQMQELLDKMNAEQRAKVHRALDDARHNANVWVDGIANPIKNTVDSLADGIINKANSVADGFLGTVDNIWDFNNGWIKDRKEDARGLIRQGRDAVKNAVNGARSWLKGQLTNIQDRVKSAVWHFFETIKNAYRTGGEINQIIADAANKFRSAIDAAVRGANELVGKFKGQVLSVVDWTRNLGINIDKWGVKFNFNVYNQIVEPAVNAIAGGVSSTINGIGNTLKGITNWLEPRTQDAVANIVNALFGDETGHLWNQIHGVDAKIAATRTELERKIANKAQELQNQLNDFLSKLGSDGKKLLDTLLNFSNSPTAQIGMAVLEVILGLIPGVGQAIDIKDTALSLHDILIQGKRGVADFVGLIGALAGWVPGVGDAIKSVAKVAMRGVDFLVPILKNLGPDLTETVIKTANDLDWGKILTDVVDTVVRRWDDIVRALNDSPDWILDLLGAKPVMATASGVMLKFKGAAGDIAGSISPQASKLLINKVKDARTEIFNGILRGVKVELPDILIKRITISKVSDSVRLSLRNAFNNSVRKDFAKSLASESKKLKTLRNAGLNDADILRLSNGLIPTGWQVHHKLPLEFGGNNSFDNLVLIKNDPHHMVLTNAQKDLSKQLSEGNELLVDWPSPDGFIYPL
jgi:F0F1-type ATP synthase membrane subunit b/b'